MQYASAQIPNTVTLCTCITEIIATRFPDLSSLEGSTTPNASGPEVTETMGISGDLLPLLTACNIAELV
jgi:hypothetical protein